MPYSKIHLKLKQVQDQIVSTAQKAGRKPEEITLIAVSKLHPCAAIKALAQVGHLDFGENYIQEALQKQQEIGRQDLRWHFIGHLQSKKAKFIPGNFHLVHTVDSLKLAQALHKKANEQDIIQPVLIQVDIAKEEQKSGISKNELPYLVQEILKLSNLNLKGFMCMPPFFENSEKSRPYFRELRKIRDQIVQRFTQPLPDLSMGMTADFTQAIEEGATILRIGTSIFGPRPNKQG